MVTYFGLNVQLLNTEPQILPLGWWGVPWGVFSSNWKEGQTEEMWLKAGVISKVKVPSSCPQTRECWLTSYSRRCTTLSQPTISQLPKILWAAVKREILQSWALWAASGWEANWLNKSSLPCTAYLHQFYCVKILLTWTVGVKNLPLTEENQYGCKSSLFANNNIILSIPELEQRLLNLLITWAIYKLKM